MEKKRVLRSKPSIWREILELSWVPLAQVEGCSKGAFDHQHRRLPVPVQSCALLRLPWRQTEAFEAPKTSEEAFSSYRAMAQPKQCIKRACYTYTLFSPGFWPLSSHPPSEPGQHQARPWSTIGLPTSCDRSQHCPQTPATEHSHGLGGAEGRGRGGPQMPPSALTQPRPHPSLLGTRDASKSRNCGPYLGDAWQLQMPRVPGNCIQRRKVEFSCKGEKNKRLKPESLLMGTTLTFSNVANLMNVYAQISA